MRGRGRASAQAAGAAILLALLAGTASGNCRLITDCSVQPCRQLQECASVLDQPAAPSPGMAQGWPKIAPLTPPFSVVAPRERLAPPPGTGICRQAYICGVGRCAWQTVCQ